jgi:hypothetical protein
VTFVSFSARCIFCVVEGFNYTAKGAPRTRRRIVSGHGKHEEIDMDEPLDGMRLPSEPGQRVIDRPELPSQGISTDSEVYTEVVADEGQLKRGTIGKFEVFSDEAARIGGTDRYPSPMSYMAMAIGF